MKDKIKIMKCIHRKSSLYSIYNIIISMISIISITI